MRTAWNTPGKSMAATWLVVGDLADLGAAVAAVEGDVVRRLLGGEARGQLAFQRRLVALYGQHVLPAPVEQRFDVASVHVQRVRGDDGPGQVAVAVFGAVPGDRVQQRDDLGELVGVRGDGALTDHNPLAVPERGEQPDLPAAGVHLGP